MDPLLDTRKTYDKIAEDYSLMHRTSAVPEHLMRFLSLLKGKRVLDAGCGPGNDTKAMVGRDLIVTCIDFSAQFVMIARKRVNGAIVERMDLRKLKFPDESFDGVWSNASFHHIPKSEGLLALQGFNRVLAERGLLYIEVKEGNSEYEQPRADGSLHVALYTKDELVKLIEKAGFSIVEAVEHMHEAKWVRVYARKTKSL
jgi:ubiquinone/menaquinone biosynthesis C-methylase UbiE